jgi:hypothetical protein
LTKVKRNVTFFSEAGPSNTVHVVDSVKDRLLIGDIKEVVVPATTGDTANLFSKELNGLAKVVSVSEDEAISVCKLITRSTNGLLASLVRRRIEHELASKRLRREAFDITFLPFCGEKWDAVKNILYAFGHGMKVAIEVSVAAVELGKIEPYKKIISVGGKEGGVDTAIVLRSSSRREAFGEIDKNRLSVLEIINMPIEK